MRDMKGLVEDLEAVLSEEDVSSIQEGAFKYGGGLIDRVSDVLDKRSKVLRDISGEVKQVYEKYLGKKATSEDVGALVSMYLKRMK